MSLRDEALRGLGRNASSQEQRDQTATEGFGRASVAGFRGARLTFPTLDEAAYHGVVGEFVRLVEPHTEGDPAAILISTLAAASSAMGAGPYVEIDATRHRAKLFAVVVGDSSVSRKGTGLDHAERFVRLADPSWGARRFTNLGSGEAVVWSIRDPEKRGRDIDPGVADKRLWVPAPEFAGVLKVAGRAGSILSPILREAWDRDELRHTAKAAPATATGAHVVVLGHITRTELRRELSRTEMANGFANRFLWVCSRRSKELPRGGQLDMGEVEHLARGLQDTLDSARQQCEVARDGGFWRVYEAAYHDLTRSRPGMVGALTARAAPYVQRLALTFALLDGNGDIGRQHAEAALAVWRYCEASVAYIFGNALGSPVSEEILTELRNRPEGMTRTELRDHFNRHADIGAALDELHEATLAYPVRERTVGRTAERWHARALDDENGTTETTEGASQAEVWDGRERAEIDWHDELPLELNPNGRFTPERPPIAEDADAMLAEDDSAGCLFAANDPADDHPGYGNEP